MHIYEVPLKRHIIVFKKLIGPGTQQTVRNTSSLFSTLCLVLKGAVYLLTLKPMIKDDYEWII